MRDASKVSHTTRFCVHADHPVLPGHFPGHPIVPGVMLLSAAMDYAQSQFGSDLRIEGIDQAKFLTPLLPNQEAHLTISRTKWLKFSFELDGTLIAQGNFLIAEALPLTP